MKSLNRPEKSQKTGKRPAYISMRRLNTENDARVSMSWLMGRYLFCHWLSLCVIVLSKLHFSSVLPTASMCWLFAVITGLWIVKHLGIDLRRAVHLLRVLVGMPVRQLIVIEYFAALSYTCGTSLVSWHNHHLKTTEYMIDRDDCYIVISMLWCPLADGGLQYLV